MLTEKNFLPRDEVRKLDQLAIEEFGIPGIVLMENAGRNTAEYLMSLATIRGPVVICCGKGNNGGDGFVVARHLDNHNIPVHVLLFANSQELRGDAEINYNIVLKSGIYVVDCSDEHGLERLKNEVARAEWIVDALFGTGLSGQIKPPYDDVIKTINAATAKKLAIDIPSGLDCDTGEPLGTAVKADHTVTFIAQKKGFSNPQAQAFLGQVHVADIGMPRVIFIP